MTQSYQAPSGVDRRTAGGSPAAPFPRPGWLADIVGEDAATAATRAGYLLLVWSIVAGATLLRVDVIVVGHSLGFLCLATAAGLRLRSRDTAWAGPREVRWLAILLAVLAVVYLATQYPAGKYTAVSLFSTALLLWLAPKARLPDTSRFALIAFLGIVYVKLAMATPGLDFVALHSRNYVFLFSLFLYMTHTCEAVSRGRRPSLVLLVAVAWMGFATTGLGNLIVAAFLLAVGFAAMPRWRLPLVVVGSLLLAVSVAAPSVRDVVLQFHLAGQERSVVEVVRDWLTPDPRPKESIPKSNAPPPTGLPIVPTREGQQTPAPSALPISPLSVDSPPPATPRRSQPDHTVEYNLQALGHTVKTPESDERFVIWRDYLAAMDAGTLLLGGLASSLEKTLSLHSSYFAAHYKFGLLGIAVIALCGVLFFRLQLWRSFMGWILLACCLRAVTDTIMFVGGYFDFGLIGLTVATAAMAADSRGAGGRPAAGEPGGSRAQAPVPFPSSPSLRSDP